MSLRGRVSIGKSVQRGDGEGGDGEGGDGEGDDGEGGDDEGGDGEGENGEGGVIEKGKDERVHKWMKKQVSASKKLVSGIIRVAFCSMCSVRLGEHV